MGNSFKEKLEYYAEYTEKNLKEYNKITSDTTAQKTVIEAMNYSLEAGGKRIRPVLVYAFCEACGGSFEKVTASACAIEMIHTFSLIHDDLPAMDNDDFRRGKPSCHKTFGEAEAILAGDALAILPFEIIASDERLSADEKVKTISVLANASGKCGMIGGQIIDIENEKRSDVDEMNLRNMYKGKTSALIMASCVMGCIGAGADDTLIQKATDYAYKLGLAFQIIDDILDVTSTEEILGKPIGSDEAENKTTFVTLYGVEKAKEIASQITSDAMEILDSFENNEFLKSLTEMLLMRNK